MENNATSPRPVDTTIGEDFYYFYLLPKEVRQAMVECAYDYNSKEAFNIYTALLHDYFMAPRQAIDEMKRQFRINDTVMIREEMAKKLAS